MAAVHGPGLSFNKRGAGEALPNAQAFLVEAAVTQDVRPTANCKHQNTLSSPMSSASDGVFAEA